jgi:hypothetical protein
MLVPKESSMNATSETATKTVVDPTKSQPTSSEKRIHWAQAPASKNDAAAARTLALEEKFEAMRSRNWITERMVDQYQKHWHCTREAALERLLSKAGT